MDRVVSVLIDMLRDIPFIDFDPSLSWEDWALPDQLAFSTASSLLRLSNDHPQFIDQAVNAIFDFVAQTVQNIANSSCKPYIASSGHRTLTTNIHSFRDIDPIVPCRSWSLPGNQFYIV